MRSTQYNWSPIKINRWCFLSCACSISEWCSIPPDACEAGTQPGTWFTVAHADINSWSPTQLITVPAVTAASKRQGLIMATYKLRGVELSNRRAPNFNLYLLSKCEPWKHYVSAGPQHLRTTSGTSNFLTNIDECENSWESLAYYRRPKFVMSDFELTHVTDAPNIFLFGSSCLADISYPATVACLCGLAVSKVWLLHPYTSFAQN